MSLATRCNYCIMKQLEYDASKRGVKIILDFPGGAGGDTFISLRYEDEPQPCVWFKALTGSCVC